MELIIAVQKIRDCWEQKKGNLSASERIRLDPIHDQIMAYLHQFKEQELHISNPTFHGTDRHDNVTEAIRNLRWIEDHCHELIDNLSISLNCEPGVETKPVAKNRARNTGATPGAPGIRPLPGIYNIPNPEV